ncbi:MAG: hypothetical protein AB7F31_03080 [Parachlamydiales bacterium]
MNLLRQMARLLYRFRHPVTLPEEVACDVGIPLSNGLSCEAVIQRLKDPSHPSRKLIRMMPREGAEALFHNAVKQERFRRSTLFSYYFASGWMEFALHFDDQDLLRKVTILHRNILDDRGVEMPLTEAQAVGS